MAVYPHASMPILDVALLLETSPGDVRGRCEKGEIRASFDAYTLEWDIPTEQFHQHPNWTDFLERLGY